MILIINICKNEMHYHEFVKPIEDIITKAGQQFVTKHYLNMTDTDLKKCLKTAHRIIITGTSLQDFSYAKDLKFFNFIKTWDRPLLAICGGMQILCEVFGSKLVEGQEIGLIGANFNGEFLGMTGEHEIYALHNMVVKDDVTLKKNFNICARSADAKKSDAKTNYVQAVKNKHHKMYGVLFHPEVRNKDLIVNFLYL
jgi:anthranilate/para-aminobenzoate synthase component II